MTHAIPPEDPTTTREFGVQPIAALLEQLHLKPHDLVAASTEQLTHKMVARALKGRRLTSNTKGLVQRALNKAASGNFTFSQLFNYGNTDATKL
jgi:hypothetical protein